MEKFSDTIKKEKEAKMALNHDLSDGTIKSLKDFLMEKFLTPGIESVNLIFDPTKHCCVGTELICDCVEALILPRREYYRTINWLKDNGFDPRMYSADAENLKEFRRVKVIVNLQ